MRREEFFKPVRKQTTVRIDADVLDWLRSQGDDHLTRIFGRAWRGTVGLPPMDLKWPVRNSIWIPLWNRRQSNI